jgi:hypothetical protein
MKPMKKTVPCVLAALVFAMGSALGCATRHSAANPSEPRVVMDVIPEAKITQFESALETQQKDPALIFTVGIQNVSSQPMRYRLNIFLQDMDKGAGSLIPATGKPPVVEPGNTQTVKIPFMKTDKESKDILVVVKPASY